MSAIHADWRADLEASRDLSDHEKQHFGFLLAWYEGWRIKQGLEPDRTAAVAFWRAQVASKPRKDWQLDRWAEAMRWPGFAMLCRGRPGFAILCRGMRRPHHK